MFWVISERITSPTQTFQWDCTYWECFYQFRQDCTIGPFKENCQECFHAFCEALFPLYFTKKSSEKKEVLAKIYVRNILSNSLVSNLKILLTSLICRYDSAEGKILDGIAPLIADPPPMKLRQQAKLISSAKLPQLRNQLRDLEALQDL